MFFTFFFTVYTAVVVMLLDMSQQDLFTAGVLTCHQRKCTYLNYKINDG